MMSDQQQQVCPLCGIVKNCAENTYETKFNRTQRSDLAPWSGVKTFVRVCRHASFSKKGCINDVESVSPEEIEANKRRPLGFTQKGR